MKKRIMLAGLCLAGILMAGAVALKAAQNPAVAPCRPNPGADIKNVSPDSRCFELRTYTVGEGSSIDQLHARFRERTTALFRKHGMTIIGYWQPAAPPDTLIYVLAYANRSAREASWDAFRSDPEWIKTRAEMPVNVQVENVFMSATDYSPMK